MSRHKYKFTNKHNTTGGTVAFLLGIMAAGLMVWAVYMAYRDRGNSGTDMGLIGTLSFFVSTVGLLLGLSSFKEEDKFYLFSWIGTILCGIIWLMLCAVVVIGI
ncbi:MAG: hypothetical protein K2M78_11940 [Lachnospiraceae bacterium]|nr:hypothetical protein [Lachnospiraceae bacterium]